MRCRIVTVAPLPPLVFRGGSVVDSSVAFPPPSGRPETIVSPVFMRPLPPPPSPPSPPNPASRMADMAASLQTPCLIDGAIRFGVVEGYIGSMAGRIERQETRAVRQKRSLTRKIKHNNWKVENHKMYVCNRRFFFFIVYFMVRGGGNYQKPGMDAFSRRGGVSTRAKTMVWCACSSSHLSGKTMLVKGKAGGGLKRPCRTGHCKKRHRAFFFHLHTYNNIYVSLTLSRHGTFQHYIRRQHACALRGQPGRKPLRNVQARHAPYLRLVQKARATY